MQSDKRRCAGDARRQHAARSAGFTLVELMITLVVLAIMAAIAAPSFGDMVDRNRLGTSANELVGALQLAKIEAVRRNERVVLCPTTNGTSCNGANWQRLIVFSDEDGDDAADAAEALIRDVTVAVGGVQVKGSSNVATNNRVSFGASGFARVGNAGARDGGFSVCSTDLPTAENTRDVVVEVSRVSVATRDGTAACTAMQD